MLDVGCASDSASWSAPINFRSSGSGDTRRRYALPERHAEMPYRRYVDVERELIVVDASGPADYESTLDEVSALATELGSRPGWSIYVDARTGEYSPGTAEIKGIVAAFVRQRSVFTGRTAIVVEGTTRYGLGRMFASLAGLWGLHIEIFRSALAARAWLQPAMAAIQPNVTGQLPQGNRHTSQSQSP